MGHPSGAGSRDDLRLGFDRRVRLEFRGSQLNSDGGLLIVRELDDALGLSDLASAALQDSRTGANRVHQMAGLFRQAIYGRLAVFLANVGLPEPMADWSLTSLQLKFIKIGARVVRHARAITFQLAEVAVSGAMVRAALVAIQRLRAPPVVT